MKQLKLLKRQKSDHGGKLRNRRSGRGMRQISTNSTMHFVMRSTKAKGRWRFQSTRRIWIPLLKRFASKYGVTILSYADPGNHIHLHLKFSNRNVYKPFIRALTGSIAMAITGASRWNKIDFKFWDLRPFSRVVIGRRAFRSLVDYIHLNQLEALGYDRAAARVGIKNFRANTAQKLDHHSVDSEGDSATRTRKSWLNLNNLFSSELFGKRTGESTRGAPGNSGRSLNSAVWPVGPRCFPHNSGPVEDVQFRNSRNARIKSSPRGGFFANTRLSSKLPGKSASRS